MPPLRGGPGFKSIFDSPFAGAGAFFSAPAPRFILAIGFQL